MFCALLATFSLCVGILQFISVELFTFNFCIGIIHIISVEHFYGAKLLREGGGCCSDEENDRRWLWGQGMRPLLCAQMRLAPALALKIRFAFGRFAPLEGQIPPSTGRTHTAPALSKNTLIKIKKDVLTFTIGSSKVFDITAGKYFDNIFKYRCGVVESYKLLSLDVEKKYPGWSPNFIQGFPQDVLLCASHAFVCQPKRKDKKVVKGMDQALIVKLKSDLCLHHCYVQDPFTS